MIKNYQVGSGKCTIDLDKGIMYASKKTSEGDTILGEIPEKDMTIELGKCLLDMLQHGRCSFTNHLPLIIHYASLFEGLKIVATIYYLDKNMEEKHIKIMGSKNIVKYISNYKASNIIIEKL